MVGSIASNFVGPFGGVVMSFIAFSIVFIVIVGLMLMMMGLKHFCNAIDGTTKSTAPAPTAPAPKAPSAAKAVAASADDDGELLAVISAAIAAMCGSTARVVGFKPVKAPAATNWKFMGRMRNSEGFQD
jgi:glutaconyl-CoA/methylmalonyl-CoA decarboxylase subunit delta